MTVHDLSLAPSQHEEDQSGSLGMPEAIALTAVIATAGMLAAGWFDLMLPWSG